MNLLRRPKVLDRSILQSDRSLRLLIIDERFSKFASLILDCFVCIREIRLAKFVISRMLLDVDENRAEKKGG